MNLCYVSDYCLAMMRSGAWGLCTILAGYDGGHSEQHKNCQINATSCFTGKWAKESPCLAFPIMYAGIWREKVES